VVTFRPMAEADVPRAVAAFDQVLVGAEVELQPYGPVMVRGLDEPPSPSIASGADDSAPRAAPELVLAPGRVGGHLA